MKKDDYTGNQGLRSEVRKAAARGASIEFKPSDDSMIYQFSLRDWSPSGLGILVRDDSDIFAYIEVGQIIFLKLHKGDGEISEKVIQAEIRHISKPEPGQHPNHMIVGLLIL